MEDRIITITTCPYSRAQLIKGRLEANGIECFLSNINLVQPGIATGVKVKIQEKDADEAYRIIEKIKHQAGEEKQPTLKKLKRIRRILVPVDFSEHSDNACHFALGLANKLKAEIKLIYSYFNPLVSSEPYMENNAVAFHLEHIIGDIAKEARKQMTSLKQRLQQEARNKQFGQLKITSTLDKGIPENVILQYIEKYDPGVVVMGTKGRGESRLDYIGSVTKAVIKKSNVPVLAIPEKSIFSGFDYINRVSTNFDDNDFNSLRKLMTLVRPFEMKIFCIHITEGEEEPMDQVKMNSLKEYFQEEYPDFEIYCHMIRHEDVVEGLQDYIEKQEIDLLALTTHKRGMIERLFNPGITRKMLFHTHIPLLVFHS